MYVSKKVSRYHRFLIRRLTTSLLKKDYKDMTQMEMGRILSITSRGYAMDDVVALGLKVNI